MDRLRHVRASGKPLAAVAVLGILAVALACYAAALHNGFTYDDHAIVVHNPLVKSLANIPAIFRTAYWGSGSTEAGLYRPVTVATFCIDHAIWGLRPLPFHVVNAVLHGLVSLLAFLVIDRVLRSRSVAFLAAVLFAAHPIHTEAVIGIVGRAEILAAAFVLAAVLMHARHRSTGKTRYAAGAALLFLLGALSKESAIAFPFLVLVLDAAGMPGVRVKAAEPEWRPAWRAFIAYGIVLVLVFSLRAWAMGPSQAVGPRIVGMMDNPIAGEPFLRRSATAFYVIARCLLLLAFPLRLCADYSYNQIPVVAGLGDPRAYLALATAALLLWLVVSSFRRDDGRFAAAAFFLIPFLPSSNLLLPIGTIMAERLLYLPSLGFCLLLALVLSSARSRLGRWRLFAAGAVAAAAAALVVLYSVQTLHRSRDWKDDATLFSAALRVAPESSRMHLYYGSRCNDVGEYKEALGHLNRSLEILPDNPDALGLIGDAYLGTGDLDEARKSYRKAIALNPDHLGGYYGLGLLAMQQGDYDEAVRDFKCCVDMSVLHAGSRLNLGVVYYTMGRYEEAGRTFQAVAQLDPTSLAPQYFLGLIDRRRGTPSACRDRYRSVLGAARPYDVESYNYLGMISDELGLLDKAYAHYAAALSLNPNSSFTRGNLAKHLLRRGAREEAENEARTAIRQNRLAVESYQTLALCQMQAGRFEAAESTLTAALRLRANDLITRIDLARLFIRTVRWELAERELAAAAGVGTGAAAGAGAAIAHPGNPELLFEEAALAAARGDHAGARRRWQMLREARFEPVAVQLEMWRFEARTAAGRLPEVLARLAILSTASGDSIGALDRFRIAGLYEELGDLASAEREYRRALELEPKNGIFLFERAKCLLRAGRHDEAERALLDLVQLYPTHADGKNALAWLYLSTEPARAQAGPREALGLVTEALGIDSTQASYYDTRAEALARLGRTEEAARAWKSAVRLDPANDVYAQKARLAAAAESR